MSPRLRRAAMGLLFVSGATGLVYELVWSKYLADVLGNSGQAHAIVLATFMGGLAMGAFAFGRLADRVARPLVLYGVLELLVGLYALAFPSLHVLLRSLFLAVAPLVPEGVRGGPKLLIAAMSLVVPTMLMGGTLPVMLKQVTDVPERIRPLLARLYAINSLGAALGVFVAGTRLVPGFGLDHTGRAAALVNLALGAVAVLLGRRAPSVSSSSTGQPTPGPGVEQPADAGLEGGEAAPARPRSLAAAPRGAEGASPADLVAARHRRIALLGVTVTGFTSMVYELAWIRLLTLVLGASAYAFTLILTAFIFGIGLGSFVMTRSERGTADPLRLFGQLQLAMVASICLTLPLYVRLPHLFWVAHHALNRTEATWPLYQALTFGVCCAVLVLPTFFLGAAFPVGARVAVSGLATLGRTLGRVYAFNTLGTISGSLLGGLWMLPTLTMETSFACAIVLNFASAAAALRRWVPISVGALVVVVYLLSSAGWSQVMANLGPFREYEAPFGSYREYLAATNRDYQVDFYKDDTFATVVVGHLRGSPKHQYLRINGKIDASTGERDVETQILSGHLGVLLPEREPKRVLLIGAGAALTAGAVLSHPIEHLDLVEISPAVMEGARLFKEANRGALDDPRVSLHLDDAKTFLALQKEKYDLVVSVPSNPWVSGVSGLFTREFFEIISAHLEDSGVLVQWVHTYESNEQLLKLVLRTMRSVFPHSTSWGGNADLVMVSSRSPLLPELGRIIQRMAEPRVRADLQRIKIDSALTVLAKQVHSDLAQKDYAGEGPLNTDDLNTLEYAAPIAFFLRQREFQLGDQRRSVEPATDLALSHYLPLDAAQASALYRNLAFFHQADDPLVRSAAERWLEVAPEDPRARLAVAQVALAQREVTTASGLLKSVEPDDLPAQRAQLGALTALIKGRRSVLLDAPVPASLLGPSGADSELKASRKALCDSLPEGACPPGGGR